MDGKNCYRLLAIFLNLLLYPIITFAQIQIGTIKGLVTDPAGARVTDIRMTLENPISGYRQQVVTDKQGEFVFNNVPHASYILHAAGTGFQENALQLQVRSNLPVTVEVRLNIAPSLSSLSIKPETELVNAESSSTQTDLNDSWINKINNGSRMTKLQSLIATAPGFVMQNNSLLHIRGVDDGILFVIDGVPTADRLDVTFANSVDIEMIHSMQVITGNIPAEFGGRSGGVVTLQPRSNINLPTNGSMSASAGNFHTGELNATFGTSSREKLGYLANVSALRSDRYLDPVDLRNFNNQGGRLTINQRADWHPGKKDIVLLNFGINGSNFRVPNNLEQEETGQRQRQKLRDDSQSISWQRVWSDTSVTNLAYFRRHYHAQLFGSEFDTPIFATQDRSHTRQGLIASLTKQLGAHLFKTGIETVYLSPREYFTFAITDDKEAEENDISDAARSFTPDHPFVFRDSRNGTVFSWFIQDRFNPIRNLTINAGVRYDRSTLPVIDHQWSPRLGAVYFIESTRTAIRASFNRLYMPPQIENLLLAESDQARALSPFISNGNPGGADIRPEKVSAYEAGFAQDVKGLFRLDAAFWWRNFTNFDDPNVFFNTTITFPNSVSSGWARGLDVRVDVPVYKGWAAYASYTNQRVLQIGPINGGLFLSDEFIEIGPGVRFIPDHDERNVVAWGLTHTRHIKGRDFWMSLGGRYESGIPLELEDQDIDELRQQPNADLVDFNRQRVKPWQIWDLSFSYDLWRGDWGHITAQFAARNLANSRFVYTFGNPFSGTFFGHQRMLSGSLKLSFK